MVCYHLAMGIRNYLIEGVSGAGKTSVCNELQRRGYHAIHGDRELAYQGDPDTGEPTDDLAHEHHIWQVAKAGALGVTPDLDLCRLRHRLILASARTRGGTSALTP